jgi:putative AlgH/UPF0301 family transcriptional regulator
MKRILVFCLLLLSGAAQAQPVAKPVMLVASPALQGLYRQSAAKVADPVVVTSSDAVDRVIEQTPNDARYFVGFVGWQPGELAKGRSVI